MFNPSLEERKQYLAEVATKIFVEKGYKSASLQDIANEAVISKATIYHYFKTKEEILYYILKTETDTFIDILKNCIKSSIEKGLNREDAFKSFIYTYAAYLNSKKDLAWLVLKERHQLTGTNKEVLHKREQEIFKTLKEEVKKLPDIDENYDVNLISFIIISMSHWIGYWLKNNGKLDLESVIKQNISILLHGILKK